MTQYTELVERRRYDQREYQEGWNCKSREYNFPTISYNFLNGVKIIIHLAAKANQILLPSGSSKQMRHEASKLLGEELNIRKMAGV